MGQVFQGLKVLEGLDALLEQLEQCRAGDVSWQLCDRPQQQTEGQGIGTGKGCPEGGEVLRFGYGSQPPSALVGQARIAIALEQAPQVER